MFCLIDAKNRLKMFDHVKQLTWDSFICCYIVCHIKELCSCSFVMDRVKGKNISKIIKITDSLIKIQKKSSSPWPTI